jgi:phage regulator Rha-like protein
LLAVDRNASPHTVPDQFDAELVEKRHDNVKRTIETLAERAVITLPQIEEALPYSRK